MRKMRLDPDYKFLGNCPICNTKFKGSHTSQIEQVEATQTLYVECAACGSSVILGVLKNTPGVVTTIGMLTDMKRGDIERAYTLPPISPDEVLEVHKYFEKC